MANNENEVKPGGRIIVRGRNILDRPLLETTDAKFVEFFDSTGELVALLVRGILGPDMWVFAHKLDDDWEQVLIRFGYKDVGHRELRRMMENDEHVSEER